MIPQQPRVFAGTLRANVDPFSRHSDAEVAAVLRALTLDQRLARRCGADGGAKVESSADDAAAAADAGPNASARALDATAESTNVAPARLTSGLDNASMLELSLSEAGELI